VRGEELRKKRDNGWEVCGGTSLSVVERVENVEERK